jgi:preprotein translocase subunit YajC
MSSIIFLLSMVIVIYLMILGNKKDKKERELKKK